MFDIHTVLGVSLRVEQTPEMLCVSNVLQIMGNIQKVQNIGITVVACSTTRTAVLQ
jgi:hypothetical protein